MDFGQAIKCLKAGKAVRRTGWNGKGMFVVKQIPSHIEENIIPKMQSLPQSAKQILMSRQSPHIDYCNQMLIVHPDSTADSWVPSVSDCFAEDWESVDTPETFADRLMIEHREVEQRLLKLDKALDSAGFEDKVGKTQFDLMVKQRNAMLEYCSILVHRMALLNVCTPVVGRP